MPLEDQTKESMTAQIDEFLAQLFEVANFDPESVRSNDDTSKFYSSLTLQRVWWENILTFLTLFKNTKLT